MCRSLEVMSSQHASTSDTLATQSNSMIFNIIEFTTMLECLSCCYTAVTSLPVNIIMAWMSPDNVPCLGTSCSNGGMLPPSEPLSAAGNPT